MCTLTDQPLLDQPQKQPPLALTNITALRYSCTFKGAAFNIAATNDPFLRFDNGVYYIYHPDGNFGVYRDGRGCVFLAGQSNPATGRTLAFQEDGNLVSYSTTGANLWATNSGGNAGAKLILSSEEPYIEIFRSDGDSRIFNSWGKGILP